MSQVYHESEHQELFYVDADLRGETAVHIPSALGKLGYYVCVLVPEAMTDALSGVTTKLKVGGLRPDDVGSAYGELIDREPVIRSKQDGMAWVLLCRVAVSRGDGVLSFDGMPDGLDRATVLLCTWPRFLESGQADDWLACQADPRWAPNGVPLGGIGAGKVEVSRDGRFRNFSGNNNQDMPFEEPDGLEGAYLAVTCDGERRLLATRPIAGIQPCDDLRPSLMFPQVNLRSVDVFPDITVEVTLYSAFLPHDVEQSSLPGFIARWSVTNDRPAPAVVSCQLGWPNLVGSGGGVGKPETKLGFADGHYRFWTAPDEPTAEVVDLEEGRGIRYGNAPSDVSPAADGHHYVIGGPNTEVDADPRRGSIAQHVTVEPYQRKSGHMVVLWAMPKYIDQQQVNRGLAWPGYFADGGEAAMWLLERAEEIFTDSSLLPLHLLEPLMPGDLTARLANCNYPLITNSVLYADGRFSINEGPTEMMGCYGTIDQRLGAHPATQIFQPELNRRELEQFAAYQSEDGRINHDLGHGDLERGPADSNWPDLTCSFIIQCARHAWSTGDTDFEHAMWPHAVQAFERHAKWADEGGGVAQVGSRTKLGTSYDGYHYEGTTPYMATLWIAALKVMRRWAGRREDEPTIARVDELADAALQRMEADLWNGRYYRAYGSVDGPINDNAHAGMLAGQWYCRMLTGEDVLPAARLEACADALMTLNFSDRFAVPPDEVSPEGERMVDYGWLPYVECFGLAAVATTGRDVMPVWRRMVRHMQQDGKTPCDTRLMYRPETGEQSWGSYYMTAPASWIVLDAISDFVYEPDTGLLRLGRQTPGRVVVMHPLWWGLAECDDNRYTLEIAEVWTDRPIFIERIETADDLDAAPLGERGAYRQYQTEKLPIEPLAMYGWTTK